MSRFPRSSLLAVLLAPRRFLALPPAEQGLLIQRARRQAMAGRLAAGLREAGVWGELDAVARAALAGIERRQRYRAGLIRRELDILARDFLPLMDVPVVALKGAAYLIRGLKAARGRVAADVDLLVPEAAVDRASALLAELGYEVARDKDNPYDRRYYRLYMHEIAPRRHPVRDVELDLHFRLLPRTHRHAFAMEPIWERVQLLTGTPYYGLADVDLFIHAAIHFLIDGEGREATRRLVELHDLLALWPDRETARAAIMPRARELKLAAVIEAAFALVEELAGAVHDGSRRRVSAPLRLARHALRRVQEEEEGGRPAPAARWLLWLRGHLLRMPFPLLLRHLATKWWRRRRAPA
ncbi:MAG: hypothetical protein D6740_11225 [Alphaproteobacteria bacterium]|nr:MAG: hypothetical protein D6740_11225 [Alphaproteobacteria bacterium]